MTQYSLDVVADSCENFVQNEATNIPLIGQNDQYDEDYGDNLACSNASRTIS